MYWGSNISPKTTKGSKQHTLNPSISLCREFTYQIDIGDDVAFDDKTPAAPRTQHPEDRLVSIRHYLMLKENVTPSLTVSLSGLKDTCRYTLEVLGVVSGIPVLNQSRLVVVELGETGTDIDVDLVEANTSGVEGASKKCDYEFHCTIFDKLPGLTRDESARDVA